MLRNQQGISIRIHNTITNPIQCLILALGVKFLASPENFFNFGVEHCLQNISVLMIKYKTSVLLIKYKTYQY